MTSQMPATDFLALAANPEIPRRPAGQDVVPASYAQELLWALDRLSPGLAAYNVPRAVQVTGPLDRDALARALAAVVERHEALRTTFAEREGHPVQVIGAPRPVPLEIVDLRDRPAADRGAAAGRLAQEQARRPFDLARDLMLRATLYVLDEAEHVLLLETHHIVSDGWSKGITFHELSAAYAALRRGAAPDLAPLPIQFGDYALWERRRTEEGELDWQLAYWRETLRGPLPTLELPTDRVRAAAPADEGGRALMLLERPLVDALKRLAQQHDATLYMVLLAAYQTVLHRYSGQDDVIVGSPTAGRLREETEPLVGYFANTLVLRTSFADDPTFAELLGRVRETCLGAIDHQEVPLEKLVLELQAGAQLTHAPLYRVVFTMEDTVPAALELDGAAVREFPIDFNLSKFDFVLGMSDRPEGVRLGLGYRTDLFEAATAERLLGHLRTLLDAVVADPAQRVSSLPLLTEPERALLAGLNATSAEFPLASGVLELFARQVARVPERDAVVADQERATFAELDVRANQLAHALRRRGLAPGARVGLCLERSVDLMVGVLGIWKVGGAYVPLQPDLPPQRIAQLLRESDARVLVTHSAHAGLLPAEGVEAIAFDRDAAQLIHEPAVAPEPVGAPDDVAYVLFTSGSTGVPKGVAVTHRNLLHYVNAVGGALGLAFPGADGWQYASVSTLSADLGHTAVFPCLALGGTLHLMPSAVATDPARFGDYCAAHPIDVLKITPSHLKALLGGPRGDAILPRRVLVLGGEALDWDLAAELVSGQRCRVVNHYGPTETTVGVCTFDVTPGIVAARREGRVAGPQPQTVPIGFALPNATLHVLDARLQPVPVGVPGELWIGGAGVSQGYVGRPELTGERFVEVSGERCYRTGDRVRRLADGAIEFLGRIDQQVKIRGFRVELGEIEAVLHQHPSVKQAAVVWRQEPGSGEGELVAYVVRHTSTSLGDGELPAFCAERLPGYMVPTRWARVDGLPLNANGKLDRRALAALAAEDPAVAEKPAAFAPPEGPTETGIAQIWAEVLKKERIGRHDSFLDLGGHSLLAIRVLGRLSKTFSVRLPLRALFDAPTVAQLAAEVDRLRAPAAPEGEMASLLAALQSLPAGEAERLLAQAAKGDAAP